MLLASAYTYSEGRTYRIHDILNVIDCDEEDPLYNEDSRLGCLDTGLYRNWREMKNL